jgi:hypothetical protein
LNRTVRRTDWTQQHLASHLTPTPDAFNLGLNDGPAAGQTMPQLHFHVIPRYAGDVPDLWVAKTPWGGKVTTSIWAQYTSRVGVLDLGRMHWRQTAVYLTRTNDRSRTRCSDYGNADWEGRFFQAA